MWNFRDFIAKISLIPILMLHFFLIFLVRYFWPSRLIKSKDKKTILICPVRSSPSHLFEFWVCLSLLKRGHITFIILDSNNILSHVTQNGRTSQNYLMLKYFILLAKMVSGGRLLPIKRTSSLSHYDCSYDVYSSSKRIREMNTTVHVGQKLEDELATDVNNIYHTLENLPTVFDCVFMTHGIYSNWGPIKKFYDSLGIPVIICGNWPYFGDMFHLNSGVFQVSTPARKHRSAAIDKHIVNDWFEQRVSHAAADQNLLIEQGSTWTNELEAYVDLKKPYLAFFPNCTWDGNLLEKSSIFEDQLECIKAISENMRSDITFVIRVHPAEASLWKNSRSILSQIKLDVRTVVIPADAPISSYAVAMGASKIVIYDGIMVAELGYLDKIVAVPSRSVFSLLPNAVQFSSESEFINWLNQSSGSTEKSMRRQVIDWMHENYFENGYTVLGYPREGEKLRFNSVLLIKMITGSEVVDYMEQAVDENKA